MRKSVRAMVLAVLVLLSTVTLGVVAAMTAAVTLAATAFIVPGTGTHNINPPDAVTGYKENALSRYISPSNTFCTTSNGCSLAGVDYPATFFPIPLPGWCPGLSCDTWNVSVGTGVTNLQDQVNSYFTVPAQANDQIIVFGYSQGGAVVSHYMYSIPDDLKDQVTVVTIGNIENPHGLWGRLNFLPTIPLLNVTFGPQLPTDIGVKSYNFSFEYDPVGDAPAYWGNPLAMLNALAAFEYVHGYYLVPNSNAPTDTLPYGYDDTTLGSAIDNALSTCNAAGSTCRTYQDGTFVLIPQQGTLPLYQPFVDLAKSTGLTPLVQPVIDLINPLTKVLVNLGYDRTINPGIPQPLSILPFNPFQNPVTVGVDLINATIQGVQAFVNDLGGLTNPSMLTTQSTPPAQSTVSTLALAKTPQALTTTPEEKSTLSTPVTASTPAGKLSAPVPAKLAPVTAVLPKQPHWQPGDLLKNLLKPHPTKPAAATSPSKESESSTTTTTGTPTTGSPATTGTSPSTGEVSSTGTSASSTSSAAA